MADNKEKDKKKKKKKGAEPEPAAAPEAQNDAQEEAAAQPDSNPSKSLTAELTGAQKAAAVIIALGVEKASLLYHHMEPEEIEMGPLRSPSSDSWMQV